MRARVPCDAPATGFISTPSDLALFFGSLDPAAKSSVLSVESRNKGKVYGTTKFDDFVEVAGVRWARRVETLDATGRRTSLSTQSVAEVAADAFAKRTAQELAGKPKVLFLKQPLPKLADALT